MRQQAYTQIFVALTKYEKYFFQFVGSSEFEEHKEPSEFVPLNAFTILADEFENIEVWLHNDTKEKFKELFAQSSLLLNLAIQCALGEKEFGTDQVNLASESILNTIDKLKKHIKTINGMEDLDKHSDRMFKNKR